MSNVSKSESVESEVSVRSNSLVPLTIEQLLNPKWSKDDILLINGMEVTQITLVGRIGEIRKRESYYAFSLTDGSHKVAVGVFPEKINQCYYKILKLRDK